MSVPQAAVDAATKVIHVGWLAPLDEVWPREMAKAAIEAAAPHIAAAERERIRQLAEKHRAVAAVDCQCEPAEHGPDMGHYVRFADLLTDLFTDPAATHPDSLTDPALD